MDLPDSLELTRHENVAILTIARPRKRNALDHRTVRGIGAFFSNPPTWTRAAVLAAHGDHFCAGLDLSDLDGMDNFASLQHSRLWHSAFGALERGTIPVFAALKGAVIGGGLELAAAAHVRVAEPSTFYALPEAQHGLFVGGGGSVRLPRLIGTHRVADMMFTGRVLDAGEGAEFGLSQYAAEHGHGLEKALELASHTANNAPVTNFAILQALPQIAEGSPDQGFLMEALMASVAASSDEAQRRMADFLDGRGAKVRDGAGR